VSPMFDAGIMKGSNAILRVPALVHLRVACGADPDSASGAARRPGLCEGSLRGRDRNDPRGLSVTRKGRDWRLAYTCNRSWEPADSFSLESKQSVVGRFDGSRRNHRVSNSEARLGLFEIASTSTASWKA